MQLNFLYAIFFLCFNLILSSCIQKKQIKPSVHKKVQNVELNKTFLKNWRNRHNKDFLMKSLDYLHKEIEKQNYHIQIIELTSRGHFIHSSFHSKNTHEIIKHTKAGMDIALKGLFVNKKFKKEYENKSFQKAFSNITKHEIGILYWYASNFATWLRHKSFIEKLKHKDMLKFALDQIEKLNTSYYYHGFYRFKGKVYCLAPSIAGGDIKKCKEHLEKAIIKSPEFLYNYLYYAHHYLTLAQEKKEFYEKLDYIINYKLDSNKEYFPENNIAKIKAKNLKIQYKDYFID